MYARLVGGGRTDQEIRTFRFATSSGESEVAALGLVGSNPTIFICGVFGDSRSGEGGLGEGIGGRGMVLSFGLAGGPLRLG